METHLDNGAAGGDARDAGREEDEEGGHDARDGPPDEHQDDEPHLRATHKSASTQAGR